MTKIVNATIESVTLGREDHGIMTCFLGLDFGGFHQGFGGYALDEYVGDERRDAQEKLNGSRRRGTDYGMEFIARILWAVDVQDWSKLKGRHIRIERDDAWGGKIHAIGHIVQDRWFRPDDMRAEFFPEATE